MGTGPVAVAFALACPACSDDLARWTVDAEPQTTTGLDGRQVAELAGQCRRCGSRVACQPTDKGAASIRRPRRQLNLPTGRDNRDRRAPLTRPANGPLPSRRPFDAQSNTQRYIIASDGT